jgi:hypothetical protein
VCGHSVAGALADVEHLSIARVDQRVHVLRTDTVRHFERDRRHQMSPSCGRFGCVPGQPHVLPAAMVRRTL